MYGKFDRAVTNSELLRSRYSENMPILNKVAINLRRKIASFQKKYLNFEIN